MAVTDTTFAWLCGLRGRQLQEHAGKWVAAKDCRFVAVAPTLDELLHELGDTDLQAVIIHRIERSMWTVRR